MPFKIKTRCRFPGCPELVQGHPFCVQHRRTVYRRQDERRGTAAQRGYDHNWQKVAEERRRLDCHLCQPCREQNRFTQAHIVDHIVPLHVRPDWRLVIGNTQVICSSCHQQKTARDTERYGSARTSVLSDDQQQQRWLAESCVLPPRNDTDDTASDPPGGTSFL